MITVIIPTYKRSDCIKLLISDYINKYHGSLFQFDIIDSSPDESTKLVYEESVVSKSNCLYHKVSSDLSVDVKVISSIRKVETDYFYLFSDGWVIDFNELEKLLLDNEYNNSQLINIERTYRIKRTGQSFLPGILYNFNDPIKYASLYFSHLSCWGVAIVQTKFFQVCFNNNEILEKYTKADPFSWWFNCSVLDIADYWKRRNGEVCLSTLYTDIIAVNPLKKGRSWGNGEQYYEMNFKVLNRDVGLLCDTYNDVKKSLILQLRNDVLVTKRNMITLRKAKVITLKRTLKYKQDIRVVPGFYLFMIGISLIPSSLLGSRDRLKEIIKSNRQVI